MINLGGHVKKIRNQRHLNCTLKLNQNIALPRINVTNTGNISDLLDHVTR